MKELFDIHVVLATASDMDDVHDDPEAAAEQLNVILHLVYDRANEEESPQRIEKIAHHCWEIWARNPQLTEIDEEELVDWVDHTLATWDDADFDDNVY